MPPFVRLTDDAGREWKVYEYSIIAGEHLYFKVGSGSGQYRGFVPVDGGARRALLWFVERDGPALTTRPALLAQLAKSRLHRADDPAAAASYGKEPERVDPLPEKVDEQRDDRAAGGEP